MTAGLFRTLTRLSLCSRRRFRRVPSSSKPSPGCPCAGDDGFEDCRALQNPHESAPAQETTVSKMMSSAKPSPEGGLLGFRRAPVVSLKHDCWHTTERRRFRPNHQLPGLGRPRDDGFIQTINSRAWGRPETKPSTPGPGAARRRRFHPNHGPGAARRRRFHPNHQLRGLGRPRDDGFIQTINSRVWGGPETTVSSKPSTPGPGAARRRRFHPNHQLPDLGRPGDDGFIQTINSRAWGRPETTVSSKPSTPGPGAFGRRLRARGMEPSSFYLLTLAKTEGDGLDGTITSFPCPRFASLFLTMIF